MTPEIRVSAAVVTDAAARALVVRKAGTILFMQPGGKHEPGESPAAALVRELREEIGVVVDERALVPLGTFTTDAANEPGHRVVADAFRVQIEPGSVVRGGEIEEVRWIGAGDAASTPLAPLSRDLLLPLVWEG
ncbi:NUDIX domain-containing protein [Microbacterium sp. BK668]|uniref:NUDIX hydrolase n=1 Tax=Microbacterium sp. BK668 TaxID=2512118 RepID=UPI00105EF640|nr:NUDIX domain-containing protein [Microbacterium sp. BK668]TDN87708.1 ADP-ribose pyrophosphatase YjhB (NUDIX family) [Microbacterium sp. BK668]